MHEANKQVGGIIQRLGMLCPDEDHRQGVALLRFEFGHLGRIEGARQVPELLELGHRHVGLGKLLHQVLQAPDVLDVGARFLVGWTLGFALEHLPGGNRLAGGGFKQTVDQGAGMGCQLVGDYGEIPVVALFPGAKRHPVQRREGRQFVAMVDQLLQHHVDDVGHRVFGLGRRVGHHLQPGVARRVQRFDVEVLA